MKTSIQNNNYNTMLEPSDWRFSAAINGLIEYLDYHNLDYEVDDEYILYNSEDITEEKYLEFVEEKYSEEFYHKVVEDILSNEEVSDEQVKLINEKLSANAIMRKTFNKIKFDKTNKEEILNIISVNREELIRETFGKKSKYTNYISVNNKLPVEILKDSQVYCRLNGYACADESRKSNSMGYGFDKKTFVGQDEKEFDFIPFSFEGDREAFFINDNYTIKRIKNTNETLKRKIRINSESSYDNKSNDTRQAMFECIIEISDFIDRDVEVILKSKDKQYFETLYLRKESIDIFKSFDKEGINYKSFCFSHKVIEKNINVQKEVTESIINNVLLDNLIEVFLKEKREFLVSQLIKVNGLIKGGNNMKDKLKGAFACAKQVSKVIENNKIESYKQKLTSSIIFKDYDRVCQILLQLSNYSGIEFGFVYDLYDDFEENKDLAYTFINALSKNDNK